MGKKLVVAHDLPAGHVLTAKDIAIKSPNDGLAPYEINKIIGTRLNKALSTDQNIAFDDVEIVDSKLTANL